MQPKLLYFFSLRETEKEQLNCLPLILWYDMHMHLLYACMFCHVHICRNVSACLSSCSDVAAFFRLVSPIICFVCQLFAEQFRSGCHTTLSGSHLNSKQLLPSANPLVITQPMFLIFQLRWANTARKLLLPRAKNVKL